MTLQNTRIRGGLGITALVVVVVAAFALSPWSSSTAQALKQGDANCDQTVDAQDALADLHIAAGTEPAPACSSAGDVDCSGQVDTVDALDILMFAASASTITPGTAVTGCPPIGSEIDTPTPTASASPTATHTRVPTKTPKPTNTPVPTASPTLTPTVVPTPVAGNYDKTQILSTNYLDAAASEAIDFVPIPGLPNDAIVALQSGLMYHVALDQSFSPVLWGDIHTLVTHNPYDEQGLLSLAFSPTFQVDGRVYLYYTAGAPDNPTVLSRFRATAAALQFDTKEELVHVQEFAPNHNGGQIVFDNAGLLYFSVGDGGGGGDPNRRAQALDTLLGKVSRIDVSGASSYAIPPSNPYSSSSEKCDTPRSDVGPAPNSGDDTTPCPEIFALGLRNPFRISHDAISDQIWAGDVGQNLWEEVDHITLGGNYGWSCREGPVNYDNSGEAMCDGKTFIDPRAYYYHSDGNQAVTGGVIYRGAAMPELYGWYVYADFYSGNIWAVNTADNSPAVELISHSGIAISDFVLAADGEIYMQTYSDGLYRLTH